MQLEYPKIQGKSEKEQISEINSFLIQLVDELQFEISNFKREIAEIKSKQEEQ